MIKEPLNFNYCGRDLAVHVEYEPDRFVVRVLEGSNPATNVVYTVSYETVDDAKKVGFSEDLVKNLMKLAKSDIKNKIVSLN